jgi:hypothetical protein
VIVDPFAYVVIVLAALGGAAWLSTRRVFRPVEPDGELCECQPVDEWEPGFDFADGSPSSPVVPASDEHLLELAYVSGVVAGVAS